MGNLNVLIGPNGSGKSNLLSFFRLMSWMTGSIGNLQEYIGRYGGASSLLFDGPERTPQIEVHLVFDTDTGTNEYLSRLFYAAPDTLIFAEERFRYSAYHFSSPADWVSLGSGHRETGLLDISASNKTARFILNQMKACCLYQFHNTSETARIKQRWNIVDNVLLKEDGANLACFLMRLSRYEPPYYKRIIATIRQINRFFDDFVLEVEHEKTILRWKEKGSDVIFGPHQASDGSLRLMALITLLLQPVAGFPTVMILDEPELGLHPFAVHIIAELIQAASKHTQIIIATQSTNLLDYFSPDDLVIVERPDRASQFKRLDDEELTEWLEEYSLAELWEKNVLGGRP